jgi:Zn-dependent protease/CBS domain-containing protein
MKSKGIPLGRILNIPIGLDFSWFLIFVLITWSLAASYFPSEFKNWPVVEYWVIGAITSLMLFASVLLHELGHSVVALHYKIPVRSITLFIFGGVAQIGAEPPNAIAEFWIAIAGPFVSFSLALVFGILQTIFTGIAPILALAKYLAYINGLLGAFNLIPGFPLDGGRVFRAIVWGITKSFRRATIIAASVGRLIAFLFIIFGVWQMFTGNLFNGLWIAFIGWFLESAANAEAQQQAIHDTLAGHNVGQAMSRNYTIISGDTTIQRLADQHILGEGRRFFLVEDHDDGNVTGLLTLHSIKSIPRENWANITASQAMIPINGVQVVRPDTEMWNAIEMMDHEGVNQLPVMEDGKIEGILSRESIFGFFKTLKELG